MTLLKNLLSKKPLEFNRVIPATPVLEALHIMRALNVSYVVVMDNDQYKGIFCETDYARNLILHGLRSSTTKVEDVMTINLPIVRPNNTLEECKNLLATHQSHYLLAFDDIDQFIAVVTPEDILEYMHDSTDTPEKPEMHLLNEYY